MWEGGDTRFLRSVLLDDYFAGAAPGAGNNFAFEWPLGRRSQLFSLSLLLTTDATVADRRVSVVFSVQDDPIIACIAQTVQTAGLATRYFLTAGASDSTAILGGRVNIHLPFPLELWGATNAAEGWELTTDVAGIQAGDAITEVQFYCRSTQGFA